MLGYPGKPGSRGLPGAHGDQGQKGEPGLKGSLVSLSYLPVTGLIIWRYIEEALRPSCQYVV